ncbi:APC family permease [Candidatus Bathyarchaeota archaeon]|nr:APC family permease [Candidatus Bathyarchaeota archaeon]
MEKEKPLLFVRKASGLRRAITPWQAIFFGVATSCTLPWHYYLMAVLPNWYPGISLPLLYMVANLIVIFEDFSMSLIYVAMPRSGSIYIPVSRAVSPMLGIMEATRSYITNPVFRGANAYVGTLSLGALFSVVGSISGIDAFISLGATLVQPMYALAFTILQQIIGTIIDGLGPGIIGKWIALWGILAMFGWITVLIPLFMTGPTGLQGRWDQTFGTGAYNEVLTVSDARGFTAPTFSWGAIGGALLIPVSNTWPYCLMPVTGEVQEPSKSIPLSMVGAAIIVLIVNVSTSYAYTYTYGDFALRYNFVVESGYAGDFTVNKSVPVSVSTYSAILVSDNPTFSALVAWAPQWSNFADMVLNVLFTSRPMFAMAMDRMAPEFFAKVHPRWHSPYMGSIWWLVISVVVATLCVYFGALISVVLGIGWVYALARLFQHWSEAELPFSKPQIWERGLRWTLGGMPLMAITGAISATFMLYILTTSAVTIWSALLIGMTYLIGILHYAYYAHKNKQRGIAVSSIYGELPPE